MRRTAAFIGGRSVDPTAYYCRFRVRCRWRRAVGFGPGSVRETGGEVGGWGGERRLAADGRAHGRRAGRPAAARELSPVRRACSAAPDERSGARRSALRPPVPRRTMPSSASFSSAMPTVERPKDGRAREVGDGGFRSAGAPPAPPWSEGCAAAVSRSHPGGHRSVIWPTLPLNTAAAVPSRCHRPAVFGRGHRPSSEAAACRAGRRESFRRSPRCQRNAGRWLMPGRAARRREPSLGSSEPKPPSCHQMWRLLPRNGDSLGQ
jgi:hypothetical protein